METSAIKLIKCDDNDIQINSYVLIYDKFSIVIDPNNFDEISKAIDGTNLEYIFITHEHFDHILSVEKLREKYSAKLVAQRLASKNINSPNKNLSKFTDLIYGFMKKTQKEKIDGFCVNQADIEFDESFELLWHRNLFKFYHTPGHSDGSCCILLNNWLFAGDSLFAGDIESSIIGGAKSKKDYAQKTLPFLQGLDKNLQVFAGHYENFRLGDKVLK